jgi:hypothetical protein
MLSTRAKGFVKRSPQQEAALRVQLLDGRHTAAIIEQMRAELGTRGGTLGPVDLSRCALVSYVERRGRAYRVQPAVTGLSEVLARAIGDASASSTVARYAQIGARPMPTVLQSIAGDALRYRLGCNWVGVALGWSARSARPFLSVITPDDLKVTYASDDPLTPTMIEWRRSNAVGEEIVDTSDLTDLDNPRYTCTDAHGKPVATALGEVEDLSGDGYWWRYADGRPFHRIVISGDPRQPYLGLPLVEGTLRLATGYTTFWAGMRDAGFPSRHSIGLELEGSDSVDGEEGQASGPEVVHRWRHINQDRPGTLQQFGPGFDPEVIGRALRSYELGLLAASGLPVAFEATGGDPTEAESAELNEAIQGTYAECRGQDTLILRRLAAITNRAGEAAVAEGRPRPYPEIAEYGYGTLYRDEIADAFDQVESAVPVKTTPAAPAAEPTKEPANVGADQAESV